MINLKFTIGDPRKSEFHSKFKYAMNIAGAFIALSLQAQDRNGPQGIKIGFHVAGIRSFQRYFGNLSLTGFQSTFTSSLRGLE